TPERSRRPFQRTVACGLRNGRRDLSGVSSSEGAGGGYDRLSKEEKEFVASFFSELSRPEAYREGIYRCVGWAVDFRPFLRRFLVSHKYDGWREIWSFNKT